MSDIHHNSDEALGKPLSVYGEKRGHVTESIFDGATHVIPLAEVSHIRRMERVTSLDPFPDLPEHIIVYMKHTTLSSPEILLIGDEMEAFSRDWCRYRHELEKPTLKPIVELSSETESVEPLSYRDVVVTVNGESYDIFNRPYGLELRCARTSGWQLWFTNPGHHAHPQLIGEEFGADEFSIHVRGSLICYTSPED